MKNGYKRRSSDEHRNVGTSTSQEPLYIDEKKEHRDILSGIFGGVFAIIIVFLYVQVPLFDQSVKHPLALMLGDKAPDGTIPFDIMSTPVLTMFIIGLAIEAIVIVALALLLIQVVRIYARGDFFTKRSATLVGIMSWVSLAYFLGPFIEHMAANMLASDLGIDRWFDISTTTDLSFGVWYLLLIILSMMSVMVRRAARMQEDQEGLI